MSEHLPQNEGLVKFERKEVDIEKLIKGLKSESAVHDFAENYDFAALDSGQKAEFTTYITALMDTKRNKREWDVDDVEPPFRLNPEFFSADFEQIMRKLDATKDKRVQEVVGDMALARVAHRKHPTFQDVEHAITHLEAFQIALKDKHTSLTPWDFKEAFQLADGVGKLDPKEFGHNKPIFVTQAAAALQEVLQASEVAFKGKKTQNTEIFDYVHAHHNTPTGIQGQADNFEDLARLNKRQLKEFMQKFLRDKAMEKLSPTETLAIEGKFSGKAVLEAAQRRKELGTGQEI